MKRIKTGLTGFILGDWLGMPYRGKGKGTFKPMWTKSYLRGDKLQRLSKAHNNIEVFPEHLSPRR